MLFLKPGGTYKVQQATPTEYSAAVHFGDTVAELDGATAFFAWNEHGLFESTPDRDTVSLVGRGNFVSVAQVGFKPQVIRGVHDESPGRLTYIDGCSDTILIYPPRLGDPCLNFLFLPPGIRQTMHTHPTVRVGVVIDGRGRAIHFSGGVLTETNLLPGTVFVLEPDEKHCFYTDDDTLSIIAYHPDSDWGPTDEVHPMKNRTIIE
jgi:hypothetical protein